jgi:hypothetical protein
MHSQNVDVLVSTLTFGHLTESGRWVILFSVERPNWQ